MADGCPASLWGISSRSAASVSVCPARAVSGNKDAFLRNARLLFMFHLGYNAVLSIESRQKFDQWSDIDNGAAGQFPFWVDYFLTS
jgi:hypothetical protein